MTPSEAKARGFLAKLNEAISRSEDGTERFTTEITVEHHGDSVLPGTSAVVILRDKLTGGHLWGQWNSFDDRSGSGRYLGGICYWTVFSRGKRLKKNYRTLWNHVYTMIGD